MLHAQPYNSTTLNHCFSPSNTSLTSHSHLTVNTQSFTKSTTNKQQHQATASPAIGAYISAVIRQPPLPATRRLPAYLTPAAFLSHIEFFEVHPPHLAAGFVDDWERLLFCCIRLQHNAINIPAWLGPLPAPVNKLLSEILSQCDPETGVWTNPFR
jgi:hypothetical protein